MKTTNTNGTNTPMGIAFGVVAKFHTGANAITPGALRKLTAGDIRKAIARHISGDWGDVCREDWEENELALREGFRLLSAYHGENGTKFWIITEADRSATTVLLPEEY